MAGRWLRSPVPISRSQRWSANPKPNVGDTVAFTVTLTNAGPVTATNVEVTDLLPAGLSFVFAVPSQGTFNPASGLWVVGAVTSTTPQTLQVAATVVSPKTRKNKAKISHADQVDPHKSNNVASATETPQQADLASAKRVDDPTPLLGDAVTFTVTLSNNGPSAATSVGVVDLLPAGLVFVSGKPSQGTYSFGSGLWTVGTVKKKKTVTLRVVATVVSSGAQTNMATVIGADQFDPKS